MNTCSCFHEGLVVSTRFLLGPPRKLLACLFVLAGGSGAANAAPQLLGELHRMLPRTPGPSSAVGTGDFDLDGDLDLVVANRGSESLFLNDGNGFFSDASGQFPSPPDSSSAVAVGDVDGDGDLDVLIGNGDPSEDDGALPNSLYLNTGGGVFIDATNQLPALIDVTTSIALGDVDGDGDLDALIGNGSDALYHPCGQNRLLLNDGLGTFSDATSQIPTICRHTESLALGDLDGDGDLDALIGNHLQQSLVYLNDGSGVFSIAAGNLPAHLDSTWSVALGDVDGDLDLDLVLGNAGQNRLYLNDGTGLFADATLQLPVDDKLTYEVALGDLDGDGDRDLLLGRYPRDRLLLNNGAGTFTNASSTHLSAENSTSISLALGDLDGDMDPDAFQVPGYGGDLRLLLNNGAGVLTAPPSPLPMQSMTSYAIALGDVNGDLHVDVLAGIENAQNRLFLGDGSGFFADVTSQLPADGDSTRAVALGDVDLDGDLDALFGNGAEHPLGQGAQLNRLYLNGGSGDFTDATAQLPAILDNTLDLELGDVDADGDLDAWIGNYDQQSRLLLNDGTGLFSDGTSQVPAGAFYTEAVELGDLDGDADLDLVLGNMSQPSSVYVNDGGGVFTNLAGSLPAYGDWTLAVALGDVDADGDIDLLFGNYPVGFPADSPYRLYLNDGSAVFTDATAQLPASTGFELVNSLALGDLDGDGDLDLLLGSTMTSVRLFLNDGAGFFADASAMLKAAYDPTFEVALGDLDHDGDVDVVHGGYGPLHLLTNLTRQVAWRSVARIGKPLAMEVYGKPAGSFALYASTQPAYMPIPPYGVLLIKRQSIFFTALGALDAQGRASVSLPIANNPALIGTTWYWQALVRPPRRLTNREHATITGL